MFKEWTYLHGLLKWMCCRSRGTDVQEEASSQRPWLLAVKAHGCSVPEHSVYIHRQRSATALCLWSDSLSTVFTSTVHPQLCYCSLPLRRQPLAMPSL
eukprot:778713-Pelagomonas_calceolata.AAC.3